MGKASLKKPSLKPFSIIIPYFFREV